MQRGLHIHTSTRTHTCSSHSQALWYRGQHKSQVCVQLLVCVCVCVFEVCFSALQFLTSLSLPIPCRSDTAFSRLRQLEAITLSQQTPACLHHTKKPCAHSAYYLCQRGCVCVCVCVGAFKMSQHGYFSYTFPDISSCRDLFLSSPSYASLSAAHIQTNLNK